MSNRYQVIETITIGEDWHSGVVRERSVSVALIDDEGKTIDSVSFWEGEPEDMVFFRDLNDALFIGSFVEKVYNLAKEGAEIEFVYKEEEIE